MKLLLSALLKYFCGLLLVGLLIFLPAGTLAWSRGWLFMIALFGPMLIAGFVMLFKAPKLLQKRLDVKEKQAAQKGVLALSGLMFLAGFVLAGLDFRFHWLVLPRWLSWVATGLFLVAYLLYAEVLRENTWLSRTIEVQEGQKVVDTGLYGIVRHPMYSVTLLLFLSMPLVLGSLISFAVFLVYPVLIVRRIRDEEELLLEELDGYEAYREKVRYRLIPWIW